MGFHFGRPLALVLAVVAALPVAAGARVREGLHNGSFEAAVAEGAARPPQWVVGFPDNPRPPGSWRFAADAADGERSLEVVAGDGPDGFFLTQFVDLPVRAMAGATLHLEASLRAVSPGAGVVVQLLAVNPEAPIDPETGVPLVGRVVLIPSGGGWERLAGDAVLSDRAEYAFVMLSVLGDGETARFDAISVTTDIPDPDCAPDPAGVALPATGTPAFPLGITNENPRNPSEAALQALPFEASELVDLVNLFVHIRWNGLAGKDLLDGHDAILDTAAELARRRVRRMLTFDFTHNSLSGLGDLNPMPDGTPVGRLDDPAVSAAYLDELAALTVGIRPEIVSVGIETDFFHDRHADQWDAFAAMLCAARTRLLALDPDIHVTTYFTLPTIVNPDGALNPVGQAAFAPLAACVDSIGYSYYPADGFGHLDDVPDGMFTAAAQLAPGLPLIIPEFGYRGGDAVYPEAEQEAFLRRALEELSTRPTVAAVWYSLHDQTYLGVDPSFKNAFSTIGLHRLDGTPKRAWALLSRLHRHGRHRRPLDPPLAGLPCTDRPAASRPAAASLRPAAPPWTPVTAGRAGTFRR